MGFRFCCFNGGEEQRRKEEQLASQDARAKAAEAAQRRFQLGFWEEFEKSAAGRAARAQLAKAAKKEDRSNYGEPVLKWQMG